MISNLPTLKKGQGAKYRQITAYLRNLINKGDLKPGTRLPTAREMAKTWGTNHFTVHRALAPLVVEGLIERLRRRGTFVRNRTSYVASVAVYCGGSLWNLEHAFFQGLFRQIEQLQQARKSRCVLFVDSRPDRDKTVALPELQKAIDQGDIQGVIGVMIAPQESWLGRLQIPTSLLFAGGVQPSLIHFFELVLSRFASEGCKTVGMICPGITQQWYMVFKNVAERHGLKVDSVWTAGGFQASDVSPEFSGYRLFRERWASQSRPDGIFVYPDVFCRGVTIAALELGVRIPQDLRLIYHRNTGIDYLCPWKIPYVVIDIKEVAHLLLDYVDAQFRHEATSPPVISSKLIDS